MSIKQQKLLVLQFMAKSPEVSCREVQRITGVRLSIQTIHRLRYTLRSKPQPVV